MKHTSRGLAPSPNDHLCQDEHGSVVGYGRSGAGFTLVEVLVVGAIIALVSVLMIQNFSKSKVSLNREALNIADAIREAQSLAQAGSQYMGDPRCGYGFHANALTNEYQVYVGEVSAGISSCASFLYTTSAPTIRKVDLSDQELAITGGYVFFVPPGPKTYIDGVLVAGDSLVIEIKQVGAACPSADCRTITVTSGGQVTITQP